MSLSDTLVYRTPPQQEKKAAAELREAGVKAYVPRETRRRRVSHHAKKLTLTKVITAPGYVFAKGVKPAFAKHVRQYVGPCAKADLSRIYSAVRPRHQQALRPRLFNVGDEIKIKVGPFADMPGKIIAERGRAYLVVVHMLGKDNTVAVHETHMKRAIDYG